MRPLLAITCMVLLTATLAGCANEDPERFPEGGPTTTSTRSSSGATSPTLTSTSSATTTSTGNSPFNQTGNETGPPSAHVTASPLNGSAPLLVNFTLTGSDPDGDALNWTLVFGDGNSTNGTTLPADVNHTYAMTGNWTAMLTVDAGSDNATSSVLITVGSTSGGGPLHFEEDVASGSTPVADVLGANQCVGFNAGMSGQDCSFFVLPPEAAGRVFTLSGDAQMADFLVTCEAPADSIAIVTDVTGTVPPGAGCIVVWYFGLAPTGTHLIVDIV